MQRTFNIKLQDVGIEYVLDSGILTEDTYLRAYWNIDSKSITNVPLDEMQNVLMDLIPDDINTMWTILSHKGVTLGLACTIGIDGTTELIWSTSEHFPFQLEIVESTSEVRTYNDRHHNLTYERYVVESMETGTLIDSFDTPEKALEYVKKSEADDMTAGIYEESYYAIYDRETEEYIL